MRFTILTVLPEWFEGPLRESIVGRALAAGIAEVRVANIRDWATNKHNKVDDTPYGGGGGMLMMPEPLCAAIDASAGAPGSAGRAHVVYTSPRGRQWNQRRAEELAAGRRDVVILCGRYEGVDERVLRTRVDEEVSLGDFVMTGGEIAALAIVDSVLRLLPGALGNEASAANDSFSQGLLEGPHYTRPEVFEGIRVPDVLLSGNHAAIAKWRHDEALRMTLARRPELHAEWLEKNPPPVPKRRRRKMPESQDPG